MVTIRINRQKHTIKVDWGAEANIILAKSYQELYSKPSCNQVKQKLKPYASPLFPLMGQFTVNISVNEKQITTIIFVTKNHNKHSLMNKYTAFDLSILQIIIINQKVTINLQNIDVSVDDDQDLHTLHIQDVQHMEYS